MTHVRNFGNIRILFWMAFSAVTILICFACGYVLTNSKMVYGTRTILPMIISTILIFTFSLSRSYFSRAIHVLTVGTVVGLLAGAIAIGINFIIGDYLLYRTTRTLTQLFGDPLDNLFGSILVLAPLAGALAFWAGWQFEAIAARAAK